MQEISSLTSSGVTRLKANDESVELILLRKSTEKQLAGGRLFARVSPTEAKCLSRTLAILIGSLVTLSESEGSLMEVMDLLFFGLRTSKLLP